MQAIILAAGMGKRLGNLTKYNTKFMVKVIGIVLIYSRFGTIISFSIVKSHISNRL